MPMHAEGVFFVCGKVFQCRRLIDASLPCVSLRAATGDCQQKLALEWACLDTLKSKGKTASFRKKPAISRRFMIGSTGGMIYRNSDLCCDQRHLLAT